jgi:tetratricopeptide (TPR) repeat protein
MATYTREDIIRYVEGELSSEEKQKMDDDLRVDASLAADVELYRQLKGTLEQRLPADDGATALQQTLKDMRGKYFGGTGATVVPIRSFRKYVVGLAAAAAILFAVVMLWPSDYLNTYGKTQMVGTTERGEGNDSLMEQASVYFNGGDFAKALPLLDQAFQKDSANQTALFYKGVALLHTGGLDQARQDLTKVYAGISLFRYEAAFYMALSYAQQKNNAAAKEWLDRIPAGAPGADKAAGLRRKLGVN